MRVMYIGLKCQNLKMKCIKENNDLYGIYQLTYINSNSINFGVIK